jgi:large subunit ribosomal protein L21e
MLKRKRLRERGKLQLSRYFQELKEGDKVAIVRNLSFSASFPKRLQGCSGIIVGKRGRAYIVEVKCGGLRKKYIIEAIHLKKLK